MLRTGKWLALAGLILGVPRFGMAQTAYLPQGGEYPVIGRLLGDQTHPAIALDRSGGFLIWQDNLTDGDGLGLSAQRLGSTLSATLGSFRVNEQGAGDQENPQVVLLQNGGAAFVWQGGTQGFQKVYARFLKPDYTFVGGDVLVNTFINNSQINPNVCPLADGNVVVVWASFEQETRPYGYLTSKLQGVYAQRLSPDGNKIGPEFQINQFTDYNQRNPAVAALSNGNFIVVWISEQQRFAMSVDVYGRLYNTSGQPVADEFLINTGTDTCTRPAVIGTADGGFVVAWDQKSTGQPTPVTGPATSEFGVQVTGDQAILGPSSNGVDVVVRPFDNGGQPRSDAVTANTYTYGDQYKPRFAAINDDLLLLWTSMGQDGSWEGVYGQYLTPTCQKVGAEFRANATTFSRQRDPAVAGDGSIRFAVVWTSYIVGNPGFDLFAQQYALTQAALPKPNAPFVSALSQSRLSVTWPEIAGLAVDHYEVYVDDNATPTITTSSQVAVTQLVPSSSHTIRLLYQLADGRRSLASDPADGRTWGEDLNGDGLPDDCQAQYWGDNPSQWPSGSVDSDGDGATNFQEFLAGTNPMDDTSILRTTIISSSQGWRLNWNTQPGSLYQVQVSANVNTWANLGAPRFAAGTMDSSPVDGTKNTAYYRVVRMR